jgi:hypothetical protein
MNTITQEDFTNSFFQLLKETFEGPLRKRGVPIWTRGQACSRHTAYHLGAIRQSVRAPGQHT